MSQFFVSLAQTSFVFRVDASLTDRISVDAKLTGSGAPTVDAQEILTNTNGAISVKPARASFFFFFFWQTASSAISVTNTFRGSALQLIFVVIVSFLLSDSMLVFLTDAPFCFHLESCRQS
jgi:hypothetical protein